MINKHYKKIISILSVLVVVCSATIFQMYFEIDNLKNPDKASAQELEQILSKIGKIMELPENETPTMATVTDPEKLRNQAFFAKSSVGDKVILYQNNKKAILYNPNSNKIIEVTTIENSADSVTNN